MELPLVISPRPRSKPLDDSALETRAAMTRAKWAAFFSAADHVRYVLGRMLRHLDGGRNLVIDIAEGRCPPLVNHLMEGKLTGADEWDLERLRVGLDAIGGRRTT